MKGFSLLEIIISITIISILTAIVANSFQVSQIQKQQDGIVEQVIASLEKAQADTMAGKDGIEHGIKFNTQNFVLFTGTSFDDDAIANKIVNIHPQFEIEETISNADNSIYFSKLYGAPNESVIITIKHVDERVPDKLFEIEESGVISMLE